jgi:homoserine kinase type II
MAVFTLISRAQLLDFLEDYDLGTLESFTGIPQGVENTNYRVYTDRGLYILTLFEKRVNPADLPFFLSFMEHLSRKGINCPRALPDKEGRVISTLADRPAAFFSFLEGKQIEAADITPAHCGQLGAFMGRLHSASRSFEKKRENTMGLPAWKDLAVKIGEAADAVEPGLALLINEELTYLDKHWTQVKLPEAAVHADIFPDNVFFKDGQLHGLIDFYFSCTAYLVYDLALVINAWCFDTKNLFRPERYHALMEGYESLRSLTKEETEKMPLMVRAAAVRILMTRLHDLISHDPEKLVTPKDPREYSAKLRFYHQEAANG